MHITEVARLALGAHFLPISPKQVHLGNSTTFVLTVHHNSMNEFHYVDDKAKDMLALFISRFDKSGQVPRTIN